MDILGTLMCLSLNQSSWTQHSSAGELNMIFRITKQNLFTMTTDPKPGRFNANLTAAQRLSVVALIWQGTQEFTPMNGLSSATSARRHSSSARLSPCTSGCTLANALTCAQSASEHSRHRRVHSGRRPYKCLVDGCGKSFCRKVTLNRHSKRVHSFTLSNSGTIQKSKLTDHGGSSSGGSGSTLRLAPRQMNGVMHESMLPMHPSEAIYSGHHDMVQHFAGLPTPTKSTFSEGPSRRPSVPDFGHQGQFSHMMAPPPPAPWSHEGSSSRTNTSEAMLASLSTYPPTPVDTSFHQTPFSSPLAAGNEHAFGMAPVHLESNMPFSKSQVMVSERGHRYQYPLTDTLNSMPSLGQTMSSQQAQLPMHGYDGGHMDSARNQQHLSQQHGLDQHYGTSQAGMDSLSASYPSPSRLVGQGYMSSPSAVPGLGQAPYLGSSHMDHSRLHGLPSPASLYSSAQNYGVGASALGHSGSHQRMR
ncbi:unnamed protein product [Tilletia laevis]|uniref:C2H2-type domain-containing protein n=1 Tax=Tilletia laevis TaxID=157183 RepID=A0A9N8M1N2_9BASI|nr:unnamed protein product [Tilletia laevis]